MELPGLTKMETTIIILLQNGMTNEQISRAQHISVNTVKFHLKNIYRKLGAANRLEAVLMYSRQPK